MLIVSCSRPRDWRRQRPAPVKQNRIGKRIPTRWEKMLEHKARLRPLMGLLLMLLVTACGTQQTNWQPLPATCPAIPELSNEARQPPVQPWCSPTCSASLTKERETWQKQLTNPE